MSKHIERKAPLDNASLPKLSVVGVRRFGCGKELSNPWRVGVRESHPPPGDRCAIAITFRLAFNGTDQQTSTRCYSTTTPDCECNHVHRFGPVCRLISITHFIDASRQQSKIPPSSHEYARDDAESPPSKYNPAPSLAWWGWGYWKGLYSMNSAIYCTLRCRRLRKMLCRVGRDTLRVLNTVRVGEGAHVCRPSADAGAGPEAFRPPGPDVP